MKIGLTTHGGWAGRFAAPQTIDTDDLPDEAAREGERLARAAEAAPAAPEAGSRGMAPEAQRYTIAIDHGDHEVSVTTSDVAGDPACRALLEWVHRHLPA